MANATPKIYTSLMTLQGLIQVVPFDATNPHFKNKYASLAAIVRAITPHMQAAKLCFTQTVSDLVLTTRLISVEDGSEIVSSLTLPVGANANAQGIGSAITYMKRYALCAILGIVGDDDDDGNAATKVGETKISELLAKNQELEKELAAMKAKEAQAARNKSLNDIWAKFEANPTQENADLLEKEVQELYPEKAQAFKDKAKLHIAKLAENVPNN